MQGRQPYNDEIKSREVIVQALKAFGIACALLSLACLVPLSWTEPMSQADASTSMPVPGIRQVQRPSPEDEQHQKMLKEMEKKANQKRQQELKHDTEKLLQLATELKDLRGQDE